MALRTSSIIRSPLLPGQGRHHRARVAHPTSLTLSEEGSGAFFLLQRRRSSLKIGHSCGLQLSAVTHAAAITSKSVMAQLVSLAPPPPRLRTLWFYCGFVLAIGNARAPSLPSSGVAFEQCCSLKTFVF